MRLLLINPRFPESFWSFRWALARYGARVAIRVSDSLYDVVKIDSSVFHLLLDSARELRPET